MNCTNRALVVALLLGITACADNTPSQDNEIQSEAAVDSAVGPAVHDNAGSVWYHRKRLLDVTGDGTPDSLDLQAHGIESDSSTVRFRVIVDGRVVFSHSWPSAYELVDAPPEASTPAGRDSLLRALFDTTLARIAVRSVDVSQWTGERTGRGNDCMNDPRDCVSQELRRRGVNVDSAIQLIASDMRRRGAVQFSLGYGFETTLQLAWSPSAREVFVIASCC